jgi:effector-binding domain-containing protein
MMHPDIGMMNGRERRRDMLAVPPAGPRAALYSAEFFQLETGEVTAYVPVSGDLRTRGRAHMLQIPAAELAVAVHHGSHDDLDQTYGALGMYVAEHEIGVDGPIREHYLVTEFDTNDESSYVTEVCWPVFQTAPSSLPAATLNYLIPVVAIALGWAVLAERPSWLAVGGGALCPVGVYIARRRTVNGNRASVIAESVGGSCRRS